VPAPTDHRELPFYIGWRSDERVRTEIELPQTRRNVVISPGDQDLEEPAGAGSAHITRSVDHGRLVLTYGMAMSPAIIPANHYEEVRAIEAALQQKSAKVILVESGPAGDGTGRN
jgi:hypothetical protein